MSNYLAVLLEDIRGDMKAVLEIVGSMQEQVAKIAGMEHDIRILKTDVKVIKAAVTATNVQVQNHEKRLTKLEKVLS